MALLTYTILGLSIFFVLATASSLTKWEYWLFRIFDFPRLQIAFILAVLTIAAICVFNFSVKWHWAVLGLLILSLFYQATQIYPYTVLSPKQVKRSTSDRTDHSFSILASNVLMPNRHSEKLIALVKKMQPDIVLTLESDGWWEKQLEVLENDYPETVKIPLDNLYGMHLYSKLKLHDTKVNYLVDKEIPSIETYVELKSGEKIKIYCLHPTPPVPTQGDNTSTNRDAELLIVGKKIEKADEAALVFGDLNDVAWSRSTKLFQKISNTLDPRIGRGFFNTYHAQNFLFRWPLDHIFHSSEFILREIKVLSEIGSDHFPIYFSLDYKPEEKVRQKEPDADQEEEELSEEKIEKAKNEKN